MYIQNVMKTKTKKPAMRGKDTAAVSARPGRQAGPRDKVLETIRDEVTAQSLTQHLEDWVSVPCPYCGEDIDVHVTSEQDGQSMYEDCSVCCRPVALFVRLEEDELQVEAHRS